MSEHFARIQPATTTYRVYFRDDLVAETNDVLELTEHLGDRAFPSVAYFAPSVFEGLGLVPSEHRTRCPLKGQAAYLDFRGESNAVWTYPAPHSEVDAIRGYFGVDTTKGFRVESGPSGA